MRTTHHQEPSSAVLPAGLQALERQTTLLDWRGWVGLSGAGVVIVAAIIWGSLGNVPTRVVGRCILMQPDGVADVTADAPGRVTRIQVRAGELVQAGQEVAQIATPELAERIDNARTRLADLERTLAAAQDQSARSGSYSAGSLAEQLVLLHKRKEATQRKIALAEQQAATNDRLREDGLITERVRLGTYIDLEDVRNALRDIDRQIAEADKRRTDFLQRTTRDVSALALQANDARRELQALLAQSRDITRIRSAVSGRVVEIKTSVGALVRRDTPVLGVERMDQSSRGELEALMFVSAANGKKIEPHARAEIVPEISRREEHGVLRGQVATISDYPSTPQGLLARIANPALMRELAQGAAPFQVRIRLQQASMPMDGARNPYDWSAAAGASVEVSSGTLCRGEILVRHERPLGFVIPAFRDHLTRKPTSETANAPATSP